MRSIYNIIDFENSRKRECESDYFNSKFFEMFCRISSLRFCTRSESVLIVKDGYCPIISPSRGRGFSYLNTPRSLKY